MYARTPPQRSDQHLTCVQWLPATLARWGISPWPLLMKDKLITAREWTDGEVNYEKSTRTIMLCLMMAHHQVRKQLTVLASPWLQTVSITMVATGLTLKESKPVYSIPIPGLPGAPPAPWNYGAKLTTLTNHNSTKKLVTRHHSLSVSKLHNNYKMLVNWTTLGCRMNSILLVSSHDNMAWYDLHSHLPDKISTTDISHARGSWG